MLYCCTHYLLLTGRSLNQWRPRLLTTTERKEEGGQHHSQVRVQAGRLLATTKMMEWKLLKEGKNKC